MRVSYIRYAFVGLLVVLIYSCPAYSGVIRDGANDQDYLNLGADPLYASVGRVDGATASYGFLASGVLIAPDWVLTAAHVVRGAKSLEFTVGGATYAASGWVANSKYASSKLAAGYDIGLIHLATPVTDVAPAVRYSGSDEVSTAPLVGVSVGFGMTGIGSTGAATLDFQKRAGQNLVDAFYPVRKGTPNIILMDFDSGTSADNAYGSKAPLPLEYLIAPGDSGGGLFVESGSCWQLIGIHSFVWGKLDGDPDSDYGDVSGDTRVSVFNAWIKGAMAGQGGGKGKGGKKGAGSGFVFEDY